MAKKYGIKHFYDITDRSDFRANPDYKGVCHLAMAQEGHCIPGTPLNATAARQLLPRVARLAKYNAFSSCLTEPCHL